MRDGAGLLCLPLSVFYTGIEKERRAQTQERAGQIQSLFHHYTHVKHFSLLVCFSVSPLPVMPQLLLAVLTNDCNQTSRRKMQNIEGDRKDTLSAKNAMYMNT